MHINLKMNRRLARPMQLSWKPPTRGKKSERGETVQRNILIMEENTERVDLVKRWRADAPPDPLFIDETLLLIRLEFIKRSRVLQEERFSHDELKAAWQWVQGGGTFLSFQINRLEEEQVYMRTMIEKEADEESYQLTDTIARSIAEMNFSDKWVMRQLAAREIQICWRVRVAERRRIIAEARKEEDRSVNERLERVEQKLNHSMTRIWDPASADAMVVLESVKFSRQKQAELQSELAAKEKQYQKTNRALKRHINDEQLPIVSSAPVAMASSEANHSSMVSISQHEKPADDAGSAAVATLLPAIQQSSHTAFSKRKSQKSQKFVKKLMQNIYNDIRSNLESAPQAMSIPP
mmetsp:Transcript_5797/g.10390  ORF Transcript_5797/g.10390 Transcript_5797/m.10390 type:complete len:351 (-) Transcript_5797:948-2000(-)